ncbi:hypothetical protein NY406_04550 [Chlorobaculum sp. MV4-Y]|uniref:hypothetical protein n=1 Tax=Chlorobaculum sp. MV4-Y TaxID=2976335 RepID=UPI0021B08553|nr:hypothetical protein [Chlorobaculum sp. MV4-Y]UWX58538.1 hypothetical protein NY406_04550 [Chlorobaculum sp. MV4-Y]
MLTAQAVLAKECWLLTKLEGNIAMSTDKYAFVPDKFSNPIVLCFNDDNTGTVTDDNTQFVKFGASTLVGLATNQGIELIETYQIDRVKGKVLFTKSRIGTATVLPNGPDVVSACVGNAERIKDKP